MMRFRLTALIAALLIATASSAYADTAIPDIDVDKLCADQAKMIEDSSVMQRYCLQEEQQAYDGLKARWTQVPERVRKSCSAQSRFLPSYVMLDYCVREESDASKQLDDLKFKK